MAPIPADPASASEDPHARSIDRLEELLTKGVADDTRAEMMFRLAGLYAELGDPAAWEKAAKLFRAMATGFPDAERAAEAWFRLAEVLRRLGRDGEADEAMNTLRTRYPGSPFAR
mgnify:CR=1 FL=1